MNLTFTQEYYLDAIKTHDTINAMREVDRLNSFGTVLIDDQALRFNARGRRIRSYEWEAIMKDAIGKGAPKADVLRFVDCESLKPDAILTITAANGKLMTLLTRSARIRVDITEISICS
jgi:hypothetical protein